MKPHPSPIDRSELAPAGMESAGERKAPFVTPRLTRYGAVVDLTRQFGGSLTPNEREAQGLDS